MQSSYTENTVQHDTKQGQNVLYSNAPLSNKHNPSTSTNINTHPQAAISRPTMQDARVLNNLPNTTLNIPANLTSSNSGGHNINRTTPRNSSDLKRENNLAFALLKLVQASCYLFYVYKTLSQIYEFLFILAVPILLKLGTCLNFFLAFVIFACSFRLLESRLCKTIDYDLFTVLSIVHSILSTCAYSNMVCYYHCR